MATEPDRAIVVFDGVCLLCSRSVRFILDRDPQARFRFASAQSERGRALLRRHGVDPDAPQSMLLLEGDRAWTESDAVLRIAGRLGGAWPLLAFARIVPRVLRDAVYRAVARRRYRWFGRSETCWLPDPRHADRFLD